MRILWKQIYVFNKFQDIFWHQNGTIQLSIKYAGRQATIRKHGSAASNQPGIECCNMGVDYSNTQHIICIEKSRGIMFS